MIGVALKGLLGRKLRAALTAFAIVLGVSMISGSFVLTDTLGKTFDGIFEESYEDTDAVISSKEAIGRRRRRPTRLPSTRHCCARSRALPDVACRPGVDRGRGAARRRRRRADRGCRRRSRVRRRSRRRPEPQPAPARQRRLAERRRPDRDRQVDRGEAAASRSVRPSARSRTGRSGSTRSAASSASARVDSLGSATITVFDLPTAQCCSTRRGKLDLIRVGADDGVTSRRADRADPPAALRHHPGQVRRRAGECGLRATRSRGWTSSSTSCSASAVSLSSSAAS